jgi:hypothetical protein
MNDIFNSFSHFNIVYIDDVLIFSKSIEEHWKHLNSFLDTIKHSGLVVSAKKIKLFQTKIKILGFDISEGQIHPIDNRGVKAVTVSGYWQKPLTVTALAVIKFH